MQGKQEKMVISRRSEKKQCNIRVDNDNFKQAEHSKYKKSKIML